ncbi:hypothetical protein XELAEV_18021549mg [Xenopus laevis]|uniref:Uncharacterized protein n=1 Tax=Xenopus laevis TaxID=8355 RepID=A0A974D9P7_XENLA|nr:hypothetical protein XELAEV_18021549mg [Xenopus laevis]
MKSFHRGTTIGNKVVNAEVRLPRKKETFLGSKRQGMFKCKGCAQCTFASSVIKGDIARHPTQGTHIKIKHYATCDTENVVYLFKCLCGKGNIGQAIRSIRTKMKDHLRNIRNFKHGSPTDMTVSRHFSEVNHNQSQLKWMVLEVIQPPHREGNMKQCLLQREFFWFKRLDTSHPVSMNDSWSVKFFL